MTELIHLKDFLRAEITRGQSVPKVISRLMNVSVTDSISFYSIAWSSALISVAFSFTVLLLARMLAKDSNMMSQEFTTTLSRL